MGLLEAVYLFVGVFILTFDLDRYQAPLLLIATRGAAADSYGGRRRMVEEPYAERYQLQAEQLVQALTDDAVLAMVVETRQHLAGAEP